MTHRRGNGLLADAYVPLVLLAPPQADLMLEALGRSGIAAYAIPLDQDILDSGTALATPSTDHLYVDAQEREAAQEVLRTELPELGDQPAGAPGQGSAGGAEEPDSPPAPPEPATVGTAPARESADGTGGADDDDVWADLVARFYDYGDVRERPAWPDAENLGSDDGPADPPGPPPARGGADLLAADDDDDRPDDRPSRPAAGRDDADHYIPPPPPPLPRGDLTSRLSWAALFGGPMVLLGSMLFSVPLPGWLAFVAVAAFIAGFVVLVIRMGDRPSGDNGPDDGAVV
ncbi:hypothetical protein ACFOVU_22555 [Nocardiopsis sediminis]|uniref:DUF2007 domain-containing protein n=1 Tax=Nocardiopsis sediminis TaxID=1778267 RepID=A0ABV8FRE4_9ACTN